MPSRRLPDSNLKRIKALSAAKERLNLTPAANIPLSAATQAKLNMQQPLYLTKSNLVANALQAQTSLTAQVVEARTLASLFINHFVETMFNAIKRGLFENNIKAFYQIDLSSNVLPKLNTYQNIHLWAKNITIGEKARTEAGGLPIQFPSIAEVNTATNNFLKLNTQQSLAKDAYDNAQQDLNALNNDADKLILKIWNELDAAFNEGDRPSMRRKTRQWGVVYVNSGRVVMEEILAPGEFANMAEHIFNANDFIKITNQSLAILRMYLSNTPTKTEINFLDIPANATQKIKASYFGVNLLSHPFINFENLSNKEQCVFTIEYAE